MANYNFTFYVKFFIYRNIKYNFISSSPHINSVRKIVINIMMTDEETKGIKGQNTFRPMVDLGQDYGWVIFNHDIE